MIVTTRIAKSKDGKLVPSRICLDWDDEFFGVDTYSCPLADAKKLRDELTKTIQMAEQLQKDSKKHERETLEAQIKKLNEQLAKLI